MFALVSNVPHRIFGKHVFFCCQFPVWRSVPTQPVCALLALLVLALGMGHGKSRAGFDPPTPPRHLPWLLVGNISRLEPVMEERRHFLGAATPTDRLCV